VAEPSLDHPGEVSWFPGKAAAPVLGPCPHTRCPHDSARCVAWGPDFEHYTLDECHVPAELGGCAGQCRAWAAEVPETDRRGRQRIRYGWGAWLHVDVAAAPSPRTEPGPDLPIDAVPLGEEFVRAVETRIGTLADVIPDATGVVSPADLYRLGATRAVAAVADELVARGWLIFDPSQPRG